MSPIYNPPKSSSGASPAAPLLSGQINVMVHTLALKVSMTLLPKQSTQALTIPVVLTQSPMAMEIVLREISQLLRGFITPLVSPTPPPLVSTTPPLVATVLPSVPATPLLTTSPPPLVTRTLLLATPPLLLVPSTPPHVTAPPPLVTRTLLLANAPLPLVIATPLLAKTPPP